MLPRTKRTLRSPRHHYVRISFPPSDFLCLLVCVFSVVFASPACVRRGFLRIANRARPSRVTYSLTGSAQNFLSDNCRLSSTFFHTDSKHVIQTFVPHCDQIVPHNNFKHSILGKNISSFHFILYPRASQLNIILR